MLDYKMTKKDINILTEELHPVQIKIYLIMSVSFKKASPMVFPSDA